MSSLSLVQSLKDAAREFIGACINNPQKCGLTRSEKHWMEELSKVYITAELNMNVPEVPTPEFVAQLRKATAFGFDSALVTRLILYGSELVREKDFFTNTPSYMTTLENHQTHWSQKFVEAQHQYGQKRQIEDFMGDYFNDPKAVTDKELTYYLTLYFKHFYRLLYQFMLFYTQLHTPVFYGRAIS